jgi:hypothetical protein
VGVLKRSWGSFSVDVKKTFFSRPRLETGKICVIQSKWLFWDTWSLCHNWHIPSIFFNEGLSVVVVHAVNIFKIGKKSKWIIFEAETISQLHHWTRRVGHWWTWIKTCSRDCLAQSKNLYHAILLLCSCFLSSCKMQY